MLLLNHGVMEERNTASVPCDKLLESKLGLRGRH